MTKFWAQRIAVSELRAELRDMAENGDDAAADALEVLKGKKGRVNFVETGAWDAWPYVQAAIQEAGSNCLQRAD